MWQSMPQRVQKLRGAWLLCELACELSVELRLALGYTGYSIGARINA
jgi:hypothetical protein